MGTYFSDKKVLLLSVLVAVVASGGYHCTRVGNLLYWKKCFAAGHISSTFDPSLRAWTLGSVQVLALMGKWRECNLMASTWTVCHFWWMKRAVELRGNGRGFREHSKTCWSVSSSRGNSILLWTLWSQWETQSYLKNTIMWGIDFSLHRFIWRSVSHQLCLMLCWFTATVTGVAKWLATSHWGELKGFSKQIFFRKFI